MKNHICVKLIYTKFFRVYWIPEIFGIGINFMPDTFMLNFQIGSFQIMLGTWEGWGKDEV